MVKRCNFGFEGRIFLTKEEWQTYCRRKPVRYIKKKKDSLCCVCNKPAEKDNPFENAHVIGFDLGIIDLALTPDYLDSPENIMTAHRTICNKKTERSLLDAMKMLRKTGITDLPDFLPKEILFLWKSNKSS